LKLPNVGVDVATTRPEESVERRELIAVDERVSCPVELNVDVAVPPKYAVPVTDKSVVDD
jgi:hypothetical protein